MKKTVLILALGVLFVTVSAFAELPKAEYYRMVDQAKAAYENGQITAEQEALLKQEGVIPFAEGELDEMGGPDEYGYMFYDSQEVGGPVYAWIDITDTGTPITNMGDDDYDGPFTLPFTFNFYGNDYDQVYICSNGYLMFGGGSSDYSNDPIPSANAPNNTVCFFWDDLYPPGGGTIYYGEDDDGNWICTFDAVDELGIGNITCQTILSSNGNILMQYSALAGGLDINSETIGIENSTGTDGLQVSYNTTPAAYPFAELAILFTLGEENASVSGVVTDNATGDPVLGADVGFGGYGATTDELGEYTIEAMYPGTYNVTIIAEGFYPYTDEDVLIEEGENTYDASLMYPGSIVVDPDAITLTAANGGTDDALLTISNEGDSDIDVSISVEILEVAAANNGNRPNRLRTASPMLARLLADQVPQSDDPDAPTPDPTEQRLSELDEPNVLIFQDSDPWWGNNTHQDYLTEIGVPFDVVGSAQMATWDFDPYTVIMVPSCQSQLYYDTFEANHDRFEEWVSQGGWIEFHGCTQGATWTMWDGLAYVHVGSGINYVVAPDHPIVEDIPEEFTGGSANHGYMTALPDNALTIIEDPNGFPVLIEYSCGSGNMVVTTETWEWGVNANQVAGDVMHNAIDYTTENAGVCTWLHFEPSSGIVPPDGTLEVTVTGDATSDEINEGVYEALMTISSDDPDNPEVVIPITFVVGAQLELTVTPWNDPTWVGPNGGSFRWDVSITNNADVTIVYDAWTSVILPNGNPYGPMDLYTGLSLDPGEVLAASPLQSVPGFAPGGIYTFLGNVGQFPTIWAQDGFDWAKLPIPPGPAGGMDNHVGWVLTGWFDETEDVTTAVVPTEFAIDQVYPNPFNPMTNITIALPLSSELQVVVFNVIGQQVDVLANGRYAEGYHNLTFDASSLSSGIYFIQATVPGKMNQLRKVVLMK